MKKILFFPASLRRGSHQRRLVGHLCGLLGAGFEYDIVEAGEIDLPIYNQDLEGNASIVDALVPLGARFAAADGLVVCSPEYNAHVSPYLKNTVDWLSRIPRLAPSEPYPFSMKPLLLASASTGWTGGVLGLQDARKIFSYLGCLVHPGQICVSSADHWAQGDSYRFSEEFAAHVRNMMESFLSLVGVSHD